MVRAIQLWLFSQPQPEVWLLHTGKVLPYQLQDVAVDPPVVLEEMELTTLEAMLEAVELLLVTTPLYMVAIWEVCFIPLVPLINRSPQVERLDASKLFTISSE